MATQTAVIPLSVSLILVTVLLVSSLVFGGVFCLCLKRIQHRGDRANEPTSVYEDVEEINVRVRVRSGIETNENYAYIRDSLLRKTSSPQELNDKTDYATVFDMQQNLAYTSKIEMQDNSAYESSPSNWKVALNQRT